MIFLAITLAIISFFALNHYCKSKQAPKSNRLIISGFCAAAVFIVVVGMLEEPANMPAKKLTVSAAAVKQSEPAKEKQVLALAQWQKLYQELENEIKDDSTFLANGFSANGQRSHQVWIEKVNNHTLPLDVPPSYQVIPSHLRWLAIAYIRQDSDQIKHLKTELEKVFYNE